jgi:hypothetical protein
VGKKWMAAATTIAAAVAIAGCGGSSGDSDESSGRSTATSTSAQTQVSAAQFRDRAEKICAEPALTMSRKTYDIGSVEGARKFGAARRAAQVRALRALSRLDVPAELQSTFDHLQENLEQRSATLEPIQAQLAGRDPALRASIVAFNRQAEALSTLTRRLALPGCYWA